MFLIFSVCLFGLSAKIKTKSTLNQNAYVAASILKTLGAKESFEILTKKFQVGCPNLRVISSIKKSIKTINHLTTAKSLKLGYNFAKKALKKVFKSNKRRKNYRRRRRSNIPPKNFRRSRHNIPQRYGGPTGPYGGPGSPYGSPNGGPYGGPNGGPYGAPNGGPFGGPNGGPYGGPNGGPYGRPNVSPYGGPGNGNYPSSFIESKIKMNKNQNKRHKKSRKQRKGNKKRNANLKRLCKGVNYRNAKSKLLSYKNLVRIKRKRMLVNVIKTTLRRVLANILGCKHMRRGRFSQVIRRAIKTIRNRQNFNANVFKIANVLKNITNHRKKPRLVKKLTKLSIKY